MLRCRPNPIPEGGCAGNIFQQIKLIYCLNIAAKELNWVENFKVNQKHWRTWASPKTALIISRGPFHKRFCAGVDSAPRQNWMAGTNFNFITWISLPPRQKLAWITLKFLRQKKLLKISTPAWFSIFMGATDLKLKLISSPCNFSMHRVQMLTGSNIPRRRNPRRQASTPAWIPFMKLNGTLISRLAGLRFTPSLKRNPAGITTPARNLLWNGPLFSVILTIF